MTKLRLQPVELCEFCAEAAAQKACPLGDFLARPCGVLAHDQALHRFQAAGLRNRLPGAAVTQVGLQKFSKSHQG